LQFFLAPKVGSALFALPYFWSVVVRYHDHLKSVVTDICRSRTSKCRRRIGRSSLRDEPRNAGQWDAEQSLDTGVHMVPCTHTCNDLFTWPLSLHHRAS
jgi:hypothetical protein